MGKFVTSTWFKFTLRRPGTTQELVQAMCDGVAKNVLASILRHQGYKIKRVDFAAVDVGDGPIWEAVTHINLTPWMQAGTQKEADRDAARIGRTMLMAIQKDYRDRGFELTIEQCERPPSHIDPSTVVETPEHA